jgi:hypothetical protein
MPGLKDDVVTALKAQSAPPGSLELWEEIYEAYMRGGPDAVWDSLEKRVKSIRRAAKAETAEMKAAAGVGRPKRRTGKRR